MGHHSSFAKAPQPSVTRTAKRFATKALWKTSPAAKKTERRLRESAQRFRILFQYAPFGAALLDMDGHPILSNLALQEIVGYSEDELRRMQFTEFTHPEDADIDWHLFRELVEGRRDYYQMEKRYIHRDGSLIWGSLAVSVVRDKEGRPLNIIGMVEDITERKEAERRLALSQRRYRQLYEASRDGYTFVNMDGEFIESNTTFHEMVGYTKQELKGKTYKDISPPKWHSMEDDLIRRQVLIRGYSDVYEKEYIRKDGSVLPVEIRKYVLRDDRDEPMGMCAFIRDVTERKRVEEEKTLLEQQLRNAVQDGVIAVDKNRIILGLNTAAASLLGTTSEFAKGKPLGSICRHGLKQIVDVAENSLKTKNFIRDFQITNRTGDYASTYSVNATPLPETSEEGAVLVIRDITRMRALEIQATEQCSFENIIGRSPGMLRVFEMIRNLADTETTVLIQGDSGTGKELVARALHHHGTRRKGPLVSVNCAALPETLLESELFGHDRGAFTGASQDKVGRFELAHGGTIFLDEIGDVSPDLQKRLLRVLQEREIERVGSTDSVKVDVRIVAATNKNLDELVRRGLFREDLYYRLKVVAINLPPLKERTEDIPLLIRFFLERLQIQAGRNIEGAEPEAMHVLLNYDWPGNIRQLRNVLEHAVVLSRESYIQKQHLPDELLRPAKPTSAPEQAATLFKSEREKLKEVLDAVEWNRSEAARILGVHRNTIWRKIKDYNLLPPK